MHEKLTSIKGQCFLLIKQISYLYLLGWYFHNCDQRSCFILIVLSFIPIFLSRNIIISSRSICQLFTLLKNFTAWFFLQREVGKIFPFSRDSFCVLVGQSSFSSHRRETTQFSVEDRKLPAEFRGPWYKNIWERWALGSFTVWGRRDSQT